MGGRGASSGNTIRQQRKFDGKNPIKEWAM